MNRENLEILAAEGTVGNPAANIGEAAGYPRRRESIWRSRPCLACVAFTKLLD